MSLTDFKAKMNKSKINKYKINNNNKTKFFASFFVCEIKNNYNVVTNNKTFSILIIDKVDVQIIK
jgi:hypothetical protein